MTREIDPLLAQQIVETVQNICGQDVNFIRRDGIILASSRPERIGTLHEAGRAAARSLIVQEVTQTRGASQPGINLPVLYQGQLVAVIGITGQPEKVRQYAHLAERITLLLVREQELNEYGRTQADKRRYALDALIHPGTADPAYLEDLLREFGVDPTAPKRLMLLLLYPEEGQPLTRLLEKAEAVCRNAGAKLYHFSYPNELVAALDAEDFARSASSLQGFARTEQGRCRIGVGKVVPLGELAASLTSARTACRSLSPDREPYALFDELTWELVLADLHPDTRKALLHKTLAPLSPQDKEVLRAYFSQDRSLQKTCAALFIHKNTLQYRLNHIRGCCGLDPRSFRDAALLYLALQADDAGETR
nr:sugar diacid recognition domain-containing protein [uncultured Gemmiger sp.]